MYLPVIVRDLSREEAVISMVDSNLQREHILTFSALWFIIILQT